MKCPKCGSSGVSTTLVGCSRLDENKVKCKCGATGIAWEWQSGEEVHAHLRSSINRGMIKFHDLPEIIQWGMLYHKIVDEVKDGTLMLIDINDHQEALGSSISPKT